jgi:hypothetical protein
MATTFDLTLNIVDFDLTNYTISLNGIFTTGINTVICSTNVPKADFQGATAFLGGNLTVTQVGATTCTWSFAVPFNVLINYFTSSQSFDVFLSGNPVSSGLIPTPLNETTLTMNIAAGITPIGVTNNGPRITTAFIFDGSTNMVGRMDFGLPPSSDQYTYVFDDKAYYVFTQAAVGSNFNYDLNISSPLFPTISLTLLPNPSDSGVALIHNMFVDVQYDSGASGFTLGTNFPAGSVESSGNFNLPINVVSDAFTPTHTTLTIYFIISSSPDTILFQNPINITFGSNSDTAPAPESNNPTSYTLAFATVCLHGNSLVQTTNGLIRIKDLISAHNIKLIDYKQREIPMLHMIRTLGGKQNFIRIKRNALGQNSPSKDFIATAGHPIYHRNRESIVATLINNETIFEEVLNVDYLYNLATVERTYVMIDNIAVCTWSLEEFLKRASETHMFYELV